MKERRGRSLVENIPPTTIYTHTGLEPVTLYRYRVSAINEIGISGISNVAEATTLAEIPSQPVNLKAEALDMSRIDLSWFSPEYSGGSPIIGYRIETSKDAGNSWQLIVANTGTNKTSYRNEELDPGTTYRYRVAAINAAGRGPFSPEAEAPYGS